MKIIVDYDSCEANGMCQDAAPALFRVETDDTLTVLIEEPSAEHRDALEAAVAACPRAAIRIED